MCLDLLYRVSGVTLQRRESFKGLARLLRLAG